MTRTVTTVEELDALPVGSVIRAKHGTIIERAEDGTAYIVGNDWPVFWAKSGLPAAVLYEPGEQDPAQNDVPAGHTDEQDVLERAAALLEKHAGMTDRAAQDGCRCGYPGTDEGHHQAQMLAHAGLLATDWGSPYLCPCGQEHNITLVSIDESDHIDPLDAGAIAIKTGDEHRMITLTSADVSLMRDILTTTPTCEVRAKTLPDREQIAELICTETGCQGGSHCARDFEIADAVIALLEGEPQ